MSTPLIDRASSSLAGNHSPAFSETSSGTSTRLILTAFALLLSIGTCVYVAVVMRSVLDEEGRKKFIYHPILMTVGVVGIPLAAILQQRLFGYRSKKIHMYSMIVSLLVSLAGGYIIVSEKLEEKKHHFHSVHAIGGLVWTIFAVSQSFFGLLALDPDLRLEKFRSELGMENVKRFMTARSIHSIFGRSIVVFGYAVLFTGWWKFFSQDTTKTVIMGGFLVALTGFLLFDPLRDYFRSRSNTALDE
jgi:hypothetical protein